MTGHDLPKSYHKAYDAEEAVNPLQITIPDSISEAIEGPTVRLLTIAIAARLNLFFFLFHSRELRSAIFLKNCGFRYIFVEYLRN